METSSDSIIGPRLKLRNLSWSGHLIDLMPTTLDFGVKLILMLIIVGECGVNLGK
jgi:hypothetical protein